MVIMLFKAMGEIVKNFLNYMLIWYATWVAELFPPNLLAIYSSAEQRDHNAL